MKSFSAVIYKIGINPVVDPPGGILELVFAQAGRTKGPIPVRGRLNGHNFVQTLAKYRGAWRLYINGQMLRDSGLQVGEAANIEIEFDPRNRDVPIPPGFAKALNANPAVKKAFDKLNPSRRKEILKYLGSLKTDSSLERNIERLVADLLSPNAAAKHLTLKARPKRTKAQK